MPRRAGVRPIDYAQARRLLADLFAEAEADFQRRMPPVVPSSFLAAADTLFASKTQSFREAALGCGLVRLLDPNANLRLPYAKQGPRAYNGRTLDEQVVNPFLHDRQIPASKGPYLAAFRRSVKFDQATRAGMKDKAGYDAFLAVLSGYEAASDEEEVRRLIRYWLYRLVVYRDAAVVPLARINRLNLEQFDGLLKELLNTPSGGLVPVLLAVGLLRTVSQCFSLNWDVAAQGINVADRASGAGGDVTVTQAGKIIYALEITERLIERARVVSTFNTKISPAGIDDYLFVYSRHPPKAEARQYANQLFSQGHDVSFVEIHPWLVNNLATLGGHCRDTYIQEFLTQLDSQEVPASVKVRWNDLVKRMFA